MDINGLDLNLLKIFRAVYGEGNVSRAAVQVGMTQSAVSNALKRLREQIGDPLFVRTSAGVLPTPVADRLIGPVEEGLRHLGLAVGSLQGFDAATSDHCFRIYVNDLAQLVFLPRLIAHVQEAAPSLRFETVDEPLEVGRRMMAEGQVDLAIANWPAMGQGYFRQRLFAETFVVMMSASHPLASGALGKEDYLKARHIDYRPGGSTYGLLRTTLDTLFSRENVTRQVSFVAAHALGLSSILASSELMLTVPSRLANAMMRDTRDALVVQTLPFASPSLSITQQWHARVHRDPANRWLRKQILDLFLDRG